MSIPAAGRRGHDLGDDLLVHRRGAYTEAVTGLIAVAVLAVLLGAILWWASGLPPTRPRPRSRYRGPTYLDVHDRLEERRRRHP